MKSKFWKTDGFLGVVVVLLMLFAGRSDLLQSLERKAYDMGVQASSRTPSDRIAVIAIDDNSIANIGRWPWPRDVHARMIDLLARANAKVIGYLVYFSEPQIDPGYRYITQLLDMAKRGQGSASSESGPLAPLLTLLRQAEQDLNTDHKLAQSAAKSGNVLLPLLFTLGQPLGKPDRPLPDFVQRNAITDVQGRSDALPLPVSTVQYPIDEIGKSAAAMGHLNVNPDVDGAIRSEPLVLQYFDQFYPSLSMQIAAKSLNLAPEDIKVRLGEGVTLGKLQIGTDPALQMYTYFYKDRDSRPAFQVDSFYDVLSGRIPAGKYRNKIVLIGPTALGVGSTSVTPIAPAMPPVLMLAHSVSSILMEDFFVSPPWTLMAEKLVFLVIAVYLIVLLPRLNAGPAATITGAALTALIAVHFVLMGMRGIWIQLMVPATLLLIGHLALVTKRFIVTERAKLRSDENSAESNRMLGLAYQGQGNLDMAWDKFRQVPMSDTLLDNLYSLALDFERKRQFNKAESVFRHMHGFNSKYRDLAQRLSRAKQLSESVILGGPAGATNASILGAGGAVEKPMLGRYQIDKELGKGAMGAVYLGRDPKIGRVVAIKTLALAQEFEPGELAEAKERFFREAETAGRLSHPNIVTIYDAGEEHDLCYIAMELLKGGDLGAFTKSSSLLPVETVVSIIARVAEALDYAHRHGVVHRDIKPGNLLYDPQIDTLKVTDFGIARLTDSSKTKTGMVFGTPSYMSPEQLAGKRIEGRSDLFSLATTLYQLLCGQLPFEGESMAQLMFKISNEPPADILRYNPNLPPRLAAFLERALAKNPDERFQTGNEFAEGLRTAAAGAGGATGVRQFTTVDIEL